MWFIFYVERRFVDARFVGSVDGTLRAVAPQHAARPAVSSTAEYRSTDVPCQSTSHILFDGSLFYRHTVHLLCREPYIVFSSPIRFNKKRPPDLSADLFAFIRLLVLRPAPALPWERHRHGERPAYISGYNRPSCLPECVHRTWEPDHGTASPQRDVHDPWCAPCTRSCAP